MKRWSNRCVINSDRLIAYGSAYCPQVDAKVVIELTETFEAKLKRLLSGKSLLLIWPVATIFSAMVGSVVLEIPKYYRFANRGVETQGNVIALHAENHRAVIYEYLVSDRRFEGAARASDIDSKFEELRLGQNVLIFYDAGDVGVSCLGSPRKHLHSLLVGVIFITSFPTMVVIVFWIKQGLKRNLRLRY
jgi:hypothetical protein